MSWFLIALLANIPWTVGNFIDKLLTERFVHGEGRALVLTLYTSLLSLFVIPIIWYFNPQVFDLMVLSAGLFVLAGIIEMTGVILYLKALLEDDTSTVVPFFQLVPIFSLVLGYVFLGEVLTSHQMLAGLGIVLGGTILSLEISEEKRLRFKGSLILLMVVSSFCYASFDALFKYGALREDFWTGVFWQHIGIVLVGIYIFVFHRGCGAGFIKNIRSREPMVFSLNMLNEALYIGGMMLFAYAVLLAPIALVATTNAYHPVFAFVLGLLLTLIFPRYIKEKITTAHLLHKTFAIAIIVISSIFLVLG